MPFIFKHIAVMPDVHLGMGSTIGSVIPTLNAVIPAAVGVDIGCGMMACKTTLTAGDLPDNLGRCERRSNRPCRMACHRAVAERDQGSLERAPPTRVDEALGATCSPASSASPEKYPRLKNTNNYRHLGTLGTGNHFIEICLDEENRGVVHAALAVRAAWVTRSARSSSK